MARTDSASDTISIRTHARARATLMCGSISNKCSECSIIVSMVFLLLLLSLWLYGCVCNSAWNIYCRNSASNCRFRQWRPIIIGQGGHHGQFSFKILQGYRRGNSPLERLGTPLVGNRRFPAHERVNHVV